LRVLVELGWEVAPVLMVVPSGHCLPMAPTEVARTRTEARRLIQKYYPADATWRAFRELQEWID
jgi:hypothetical protein